MARYTALLCSLVLRVAEVDDNTIRWQKSYPNNELRSALLGLLLPSAGNSTIWVRCRTKFSVTR
jgi:hypothetical protein